jgi:O-methyltransferase involved in polyketide biosynthesis
VEPLVRFLQEDAKKVEISEATVVMIYLGADANLRLVERLRSELSPGARIVSRNFRIYGWTPNRLEKHVLPNGIESSLYLWRIGELPTKDSAAECSMNSAEPSKKHGS